MTTESLTNAKGRILLYREDQTPACGPIELKSNDFDFCEWAEPLPGVRGYKVEGPTVGGMLRLQFEDGSMGFFEMPRIDLGKSVTGPILTESRLRSVTYRQATQRIAAWGWGGGGGSKFCKTHGGLDRSVGPTQCPNCVKDRAVTDAAPPVDHDGFPVQTPGDIQRKLEATIRSHGSPIGPDGRPMGEPWTKKYASALTAPTLAVPCSREGCNHVTEYPLGTLDEREGRCAHVFRFDIRKGRYGVVECTNCPLTICAEHLRGIGIHPEKRYDHDGNTLADEAQRLRDENRFVFAENARLRMQVERLERAKGGRR